jgi:hypothetical protein
MPKEGNRSANVPAASGAAAGAAVGASCFHVTIRFEFLDMLVMAEFDSKAVAVSSTARHVARQSDFDNLNYSLAHHVNSQSFSLSVLHNQRQIWPQTSDTVNL